MNIDVTFPNAPCYLIDLDIASSIQTNSETTSKQELVRNRLDKDGILVGTADPDPQDPSSMITAIKDSLTSGEQCHIKGKIHLYKVTGKI